MENFNEDLIINKAASEILQISKSMNKSPYEILKEAYKRAGVYQPKLKSLGVPRYIAYSLEEKFLNIDKGTLLIFDTENKDIENFQLYLIKFNLFDKTHEITAMYDVNNNGFIINNEGFILEKVEEIEVIGKCIKMYS